MVQSRKSGSKLPKINTQTLVSNFNESLQSIPDNHNVMAEINDVSSIVVHRDEADTSKVKETSLIYAMGPLQTPHGAEPNNYDTFGAEPRELKEDYSANEVLEEELKLQGKSYNASTQRE